MTRARKSRVWTTSRRLGIALLLASTLGCTNDPPAAHGGGATGGDTSGAESESAWISEVHRAIARGDATAAWAIVEPRAQAGSPEAMSLMGDFHRDGFGVARDHASANEWYRRAIALGDARAMNMLGVQYARGAGVVRDEVEAVRWYRSAAELGLAEAQYNLALRYAEGRGVERDFTLAAHWYEKAVAQNHLKAMNNYGLFLYHEANEPEDRDRAISLWASCAGLENATCAKQLVAAYSLQNDPTSASQWAKRGAALGDPQSQYMLALMYYQGHGVAKNERKAYRWRERAAIGGWPEAQLHLAQDCLNGQVPGCDDERAFEWAEMAAEAGLPKAQTLVARLHTEGRGTPENEALGLRWLHRAAQSGESFAQGTWADHLWRNEAKAEAVEFWQAAAEAGQLQAMVRLGGAYEMGFPPTPPNPELADHWYREAAKRGDAKGMLLLGQMLVRGPASGRPEGIDWLERAASAGRIDAHQLLGNAYIDGRGVEKDPLKAFRHWMKAAEGGMALSQNNVGYSLLTGAGVARDTAQAIVWLERAAEQNQPNALLTLAGLYARGAGVQQDLVRARSYAEAARAAGADSESLLRYLDSAEAH